MVLCLSFGANREENSATVIPPKAWTSRNNLQVDGTETITSPLHCNTTMATICQMASGIYSPVGSLSGVGKTQHTGELLCQHEVQEEQRLGIQVTRHVTLLQSSGKKFRDKLVLARAFFPETLLPVHKLHRLGCFATKPVPTVPPLFRTSHSNTAPGRGRRPMLF